MSTVDIVEAVASAPPTPCEVCRCPHTQNCAAKRLACRSFVQYVKSGGREDYVTETPDGEPTRFLYLQAMLGLDGARKSAKGLAA